MTRKLASLSVIFLFFISQKLLAQSASSFIFKPNLSCEVKEYYPDKKLIPAEEKKFFLLDLDSKKPKIVLTFLNNEVVYNTDLPKKFEDEKTITMGFVNAVGSTEFMILNKNTGDFVITYSMNHFESPPLGSSWAIWVGKCK